MEKRNPCQLPSLESLQPPGSHGGTDPDSLEPTGGRTCAAFSPARVEGKGRELRAQRSNVQGKARRLPISLLITAIGKGFGITAEGEWDVKQGKQASLLTEQHFCIAAMAGVPHQASSCQAPYMHQACKTSNGAERSNASIFIGLQTPMKDTKNLSITTRFLKLKMQIYEEIIFGKKHDLQSLSQTRWICSKNWSLI